MNYLIGNFLTELQNAYKAYKREITFPFSNSVIAIAKILAKEGYIKKVSEKSEGNKKNVVVELQYTDRTPALHEVKIISKPSVHIYAGRFNTEKYGKGLTIISTNKGIMSSKAAKKEGLGGEVICRVS